MAWLKKVKNHFKERKLLLKKQLKEIEKARDESPSAMESHSDVSRSINERFAEALKQEIFRVDEFIKDIPGQKKKTKKISLWDYVEIKDAKKTIKLILVPDGMGGGILEKKVKMVSVSTPFSAKFLGRKVDEEVVLADSKVKIVKKE